MGTKPKTSNKIVTISNNKRDYQEKTNFKKDDLYLYLPYFQWV
jgi:hypothetical protein